MSLPNASSNVIRQLNVGTLVARQIRPVYREGIYPHVGRKLLEKYNVIIDHRKNRIYFEQPTTD
ncbi:MAG: hypothetical protein GKR87_01945 [Kiritimatiellae bacterium]|nr:hypothetical protein [Kiritimatiellia bacterium]